MHHQSKIHTIETEEGQEIDDEKQSCIKPRLPRTAWIEIPEEYQKYELTVAQVKKETQEFDEVLRKFYKEEEGKTLAGESSVRNMVLPSVELCR